MMTRLNVELTPTEYELLFELARADLRSPVDHLRYLLRQEIQRHESSQRRDGSPAVEARSHLPLGQT